MYKTILVHVDEAAGSAQRIAAACRLALAEDAHLVGMALTGLQTCLLPAGDEASLERAGVPLARLHAQARAALDRFEAAAAGAGVGSVESRCVDDEAGIGISLQARYCDLVVISRSDPEAFEPRLRSDFPDYVVLNAPRPVLVLPPGAAPASFGQRITVAWNGSAEAARAVAGALGMLRRALQVDVAVFDAAGAAGPADDPGADLVRYLARHGVQATASRRDGGQAEDLLAFAGERRADLIVMGAYGHTRFREILLGGMTRGLLGSSPIALWMAH